MTKTGLHVQRPLRTWSGHALIISYDHTLYNTNNGHAKNKKKKKKQKKKKKKKKKKNRAILTELSLSAFRFMLCM